MLIERFHAGVDTATIQLGWGAAGRLRPASFDTAKFPTATFRSTKVTFAGDRPARITGDLTIKGITRPVTLTVTSFSNKEHPMVKKEAIGANATGVIRRSEFNAGYAVPAVGDDVRLDIALEATTK